jgi:hypothetical protein
MSSHIANQVPFLRASRQFPEDLHQFSLEINKAYIEIANAVNNRTISIFPINKPVVNGESWFVSMNKKQQGLRQIYTFTSAGSVPHGINLEAISGFTKIYGTFTDGTYWYPLPYVDVANADNQINIIISGSDIVITAGSGSPPSIQNGYVVLEWISFP